MHYFINREKIGIIIRNINSVANEINKLEKELKNYEFSIMEIKKEIKYLGQSKKRFYEEINSLIVNN